jgi:hypothetical protein
LPGTAAYLLRLPGGINIFAVVNTLAFDEHDRPSSEFYGDLDAALGRALAATSTWPAHDLYASQLPCQPRRRAVRR